jgi:hypothetical protein
MTRITCEGCENGFCEQFDDVPARIKRVKLPDGSLSTDLKDIGIFRGEIKDCPLIKPTIKDERK